MRGLERLQPLRRGQPKVRRNQCLVDRCRSFGGVQGEPVTRGADHAVEGPDRRVGPASLQLRDRGLAHAESPGERGLRKPGPGAGIAEEKSGGFHVFHYNQ